MKMKKVIKDLFHSVKKYFENEVGTCRLLEINVSKQEVKFQIKVKLPILKCSIEQAINELDLVDRLSPIEACYLGGHYGRAISENRSNGKGDGNINKDISFFLKKSVGRCQILHQKRSGAIGYYDKKLKKEFLNFPLIIVNDDNLISRFNSSQACYIGILAGIELGKKGLENGLIKKNPSKEKVHLRIVK